MTNKIKRPIVMLKTNRVKLVELLINKISILNLYFYRENSLKVRDNINLRLEMLVYLLRNQDYDNSELLDKEFKSLTEFILQLIENIKN